MSLLFMDPQIASLCIVRWTPSMIYVGGGIDEYNLLVTKTPNDVFVHWFGRKL